MAWCRNKCLLLLFMILIDARSASAQVIDQTLRTELDKLLELIGSAQIAQQTASLVSGQILDGLRRSKPQVPERAIEIAKEVLDSEFAKAFARSDGLNAQIAAIYAKHFTADEVRGLLVFYGSDLGKKTLAIMPLLIQEAAVVGQEWAKQHMPQIMAALQSRLRDEGYIR